jgi:pyruvate dehydrogenase E1 component
MSTVQDIDPIETQEWLDAFKSVIRVEGRERGEYLLKQLMEQAKAAGVPFPDQAMTAYLNTIPTNQEPTYPGDISLEDRFGAYLRWNAMAMVLRAGKKAPEVGGHIATFASSAILYEVGLHHFFRRANSERQGDMILLQGHSTPGIYAYANFEGRLTQEQLDNFRQEVGGKGISSYPHPWLMRDFWEFPTVSMGLGPIQGIYQARFLKYIGNRGLQNTDGRKVWVFCGDGEMDEPESTGALRIATKEQLDNLIFVVNCNLQRLDGPVHGNGKVIQELEGLFRGAGWNVVKSLWSHQWDALFAKDTTGALRQRLEQMNDGEFQYFKAKDGAKAREILINGNPNIAAVLADLSDQDIENLHFAGHDRRCVYAAYKQATEFNNKRPTLVLIKTTKGYGMGTIGQGQNTAHQQKKMHDEDLLAFRDRFQLPLTDAQVKAQDYIQLAADSEEVKYINERRAQLGGAYPHRRALESTALKVPALKEFATFMESTGEREFSTTMGFVRILSHLLKDKEIHERIVPIIPDECRTFGMEGMFRQFGIYSPAGQLYTPVDAEQLMFYKEDQKGQVLEEGITESGAMASWMAAATSYSTNDLPMIPFYIYYSMFGFQRFGDLAWAAGDMQARGFIVGGTAGRTTLAGEGLQHQDGHSHVLAGTIPNCITYDPTFLYELAVIIQDGMRRMYQEQEHVYYYITVMNENYVHPAMPKGAEAGIVKGLYLLRKSKKSSDKKVQLLGSGTILREVLAAADVLEKEYDVAADVWSATSFNELARQAQDVERDNRLHPERAEKHSYVHECLAATEGPIVAATDYIRNYAEQIRGFIGNKSYTVLGTDGYGRSDERGPLRYFFEVNSDYIAHAALSALAKEGSLPASTVTKAMKQLNIHKDKPNPVTV